MFRLCTEQDELHIMTYLQKDCFIHTFIIADIEKYGFTSDFQKVYMMEDEKKECRAIALMYYTNLLISGDKEAVDYDFLADLMKQGIKIVMGEGELVEQVHKYTGQVGKYEGKMLYTLKDTKQLYEEVGIQQATVEDVDAIYEFLMAIDEIKHLYEVKEMITNRIANDEGKHFLKKQGDVIIAHANSAAGTNQASMIGGISVQPTYRGKGYGKEVVSAVCRDIITSNKTACIFAKPTEAGMLLDLGFMPYAKWGMLFV